ncbi:spermidine synthase [Nocardioides coralli]|uniref:spermidine synthase n=1 Tax=Nocardioides coralli TaxID=2872154 RepID=UPI001CA432AE|nr:hypothetical protein [Nocardioides coralli]QZY28527.1 hypothetical protein K6T13_13805 [Nocardioides coralli]
MEYVELARAESERGELVLRDRREADGASVLELRVNGIFVMDSAEVSSEQALAEAALARVAQPRDVLVGGLGLGYTVHAVTADRRVERCTVVEVEEALVGWMRDGTVPHGPSVLADDRVRVVVAELGSAVAEARDEGFDLVLLDVDNGPHFLVHDGNARLYRTDFVRQTRRIIRPGGAMAVWSMDRAADVLDALESVFDEVEAVPCPVRLQERDETYWLLVGTVAP